MSKKTRRIIFYIFLILFIGLAITITLYALGYNLSLQKKPLTVTGAFYFKSQPKKADIFINEENRGTTNKFIGGMNPGQYNIKISKPGYSTWKKKIEVEPKIVTKISDILLIPKEINLEKTIDYKVKNFYISQNSEKAIYLTAPKPTLRLIDFLKKTDVQIYPDKENQFLLPALSSLSQIKWSSHNQNLLLNFKDNSLYALNLNNSNQITNIKASTFHKYNFKDVTFHPTDPNKIYFLDKNTIYLLDITEKSIERILYDVLSYTIYENKILYLSKSNGVLFKADLDTSSFEKIAEFPLFKSEENITIISDKLIMLGEKLYLFESEANIFKNIGTQVESYIFSENKEKFLFKTNNTIKIIWLEKSTDDIFRNKYEIETIASYPNNIIKNIAWFTETNKHIIFVLDNKIKIAELYNSNHRNIMNIISSLEKPEIFFNKYNNYLYILSEQNLHKINMDIK